MFEWFKKKEVPKAPIVERELKSASEMKKYAKRAWVSRQVVLNKIHEAAKETRSLTSIRGSLTEELKKELTDAGYKIEEYVSDRGYYCTEISWEC